MMLRFEKSCQGLAALLIATGLTACANYTTLQTAKVKHGLHLGSSAGFLQDQHRKGKSQGSDLIGLVAPSFGFGRDIGIEVGVPFGLYFEDGFEGEMQIGGFPPYFEDEDSRHFVLFPYFKVSSNQDARDVFAGVVDLSSVSLIYSRDFGRMTPYISLKKVLLFGSPAIDDIPDEIRRYQEDRQSIFVIAAGVEVKRKLQPTFEIGLMRNRHEELVLAQPGEPADLGLYRKRGARRVLYDLSLACRVTW